MPIPDLQTNPTNDGQSVSDSTDWANVATGLSGSGILTGCVVSAFATPGMGVQITSGSIAAAGTQYGLTAASLTVQPASTTDRRDIVVAFPSGFTANATVVEGTPCGTAGWTRNTFPGLPPVKPALAGGAIYLGEIYVPAGALSIVNGNILPSVTIDQPVQAIQGLSGNITLYSPNSSVTITTSGASVGLTAIGGGGGGSVSSVFGRTGIITAQSSDYSSFYDANGNAATASVAVLASSLQKTGGSVTGPISMQTNAITGITQESNVVNLPSVSAGAVTVLAAANRQSQFTVTATTAITMSTTGFALGLIALVTIFDAGSAETLTWVNTENSTTSVPLISKGSTTSPTYVLFRANATTTKWACLAVS